MRCTQPTRERVYLYWIKTKEVGATGHLDNGLRRLLSYYWPKISVEAVSNFQVQYWKRGQITNGESGLVSPRNLAHFWSAKFCNFDTRVMHSAGLHKLWYPGIRDMSTWGKFGAHGEHGDVFLFSNLGAL